MNSKILSAVASAIALAVSAQAFAIPQGTSPTGSLNVAGATATDRVLADTLLDSTKGLCAANAIAAGASATDVDGADVFTAHTKFGTFPTAVNDRNTYENYAIVCKYRNASTNIPASTVVVVRKSSGGSGDSHAAGTGALITNTAARKWVDYAACKGTGGTVPAGVTVTDVTTDTGRIEYHLYTNCAQTSGSIAPRVGVSDLELKFIGANATQQAANVQQRTVGVIFGPAVNKVFFEALQRAEGITSAACGNGTNAVRANTTEECLPSLSTPQLRGIFKGDLRQMDPLLVNNFPGVDVPAGPIKGVVVCRRSDTSGTQNSFQTYFLGQKCGGGLLFIAAGIGAGGTGSATAGTAWSSANSAHTSALVFGGTGTDDVKACMNYHNSVGNYAIGTVSTENDYDDTNNLHRFIKVDGVAPSLENVVAGKYQFFTENQLVSPSGTGAAVLAGAELDLSTGIQSTLADPALVKGAIVSYPFGFGGIVSIPNGTTIVPPTTVNSTTVSNTPVNSQRTAFTVTGATNSCLPRYIAIPSGVRQ